MLRLKSLQKINAGNKGVMMNKKGFSLLLVIIITSVLSAMIVVGSFYIKNSKPELINNYFNSDISSSQNKLLNIVPLNKTSSSRKILASKACQLSLTYPAEWKGVVIEKNQDCTFKIIHPSINVNVFTLTNSHIYTPTQGDIEASKKPDAKTIYVDDVEGFRQYREDKEEIFFQKGEMLFNVILSRQPKDQEALRTYNEIIDSIKFIGNPSDYKITTKVTKEEFESNRENQVKDFSLKNNASALQTLVEKFREEQGKYPLSIEELKTQEDYDAWLLNVTGTNTKVEDYVYKNNGNSYSISVVLSNGTIHSTSK